jgi:hypothetical protein
MVPVLDDHSSIGMMAPAMIPMFAKLGMGAAKVIAMVDADHFSTCDRWGRQTEGNDCRDDISKLLHDIIFSCCVDEDRTSGAR